MVEHPPERLLVRRAGVVQGRRRVEQDQHRPEDRPAHDLPGIPALQRVQDEHRQRHEARHQADAMADAASHLFLGGQRPSHEAEYATASCPRLRPMHLESRKATSKSTIAARARTLHAKDLAWLEGFPLAVEDGCVRWISVPPQAPAEEIRVEGRHLSRATWTLNKLRTELRAGAAAPRGRSRCLALLHRAPPRAAQGGGPPRPAAAPRRFPLAGPLLGPCRRSGPGADGPRDSPGTGPPATACSPSRLGEQPGLLVMLRLLQLAADHGRSA